MKSHVFIILFSCLDICANAQNFQWVKQLGGQGSDEVNAITLDDAKNIYTTGYYNGTVDFDPGINIHNLTSVGASDIFIQKLDVAGSLVWAKSIGGISNEDKGFSIITDQHGNIYCIGAFNGIVDFDPGAGVFNLSANGTVGTFIIKLDSTGGFIWARNMSSFGICIGRSIALDHSGNLYTTGYFNNTVDFDPGSSVYNMTAAPTYVDCFIQKLDTAGNFIWAKQLGGASAVSGRVIKVDAQDNVLLVGNFTGNTDFDPGSATNILTPVGATDLFIEKFDQLGNYQWVKQIGGTFNDEIYSMTLDGSDNILITGSFENSVDFDPNSSVYSLTSIGNKDIFIEKLNNNGNFIWVKQIGGISAGGEGQCLTVDSQNNVYLTGSYAGTIDFDPGSSIFNLTSLNSTAIFIEKLNQSGDFRWCKQMVGTGGGHGFSIAVDSLSNVYTAGVFAGDIDFDVNPDTFNLSSNNIFTDIFIHKLDQTCLSMSFCNIYGQGKKCYSDYPYTNAPGSACVLTNNDCTDGKDAWGFCRYNCTSWDAWCINKTKGYTDTLLTQSHFFTNDTVNGMPVPGRLGNAIYWKFKLEAAPFFYVCNKIPAVGSIAWWGDHTGDGSGIGTAGHVAYVSCVNDDSVTLTEYNFAPLCYYSVRYVDNSLAYGPGNRKPDYYIHIEASPNSVIQIKQRPSFDIFPNPANDIIRVILRQDYIENQKLVIYDIVGKIVFTKQLDVLYEYKIDISDFVNGLYIIQILSPDHSETKKFEIIR